MFISRTIDAAATPVREDYREEGVRKGEKEKRTMDASSAFELVRTLHRPAITLVRRVVRRTGIRELSCRVAFGMDDPAETGILTGFLYAVSSVLTRFSDAEVRLHPVFHEQTFAYRTRGSISVTVGRMVVPIFTFISSRPVRGAVVGCVRKRLWRSVRT
jgi:hypothetical protein